MTVHKLFLKPLQLPDGAGLNIGQTYEFVAPERSKTFGHSLNFSVNGNYKIEYWANDDAGNVSDKKSISFSVKPFSAPRAISGSMWAQPISENSLQARLVHGRLSFVFEKNDSGFGAKFDWTDLDLSGLSVVGDCVSFVPGSWIYNILRERHRTFKMSFAVAQSGKVFVDLGKERFYLFKDGSSVIPVAVQGYIDQVEWKDGLWHCRVLKPIKLGLE